MVEELLNAFPCVYLAGLTEWITSHKDILAHVDYIDEVSPEVLKKASLMDSPQQVIALFRKEQKVPKSISTTDTDTKSTDIAHILSATKDNTSLILALDCVQDPGNLGTIIRLANWFGIKHIVCSKDCVDCFSPKVVQSTMGALSRVSIRYTDLVSFLKSLDPKTMIYGTFLNGENIYTCDLNSGGVIVMGNEGKGISDAVSACVGKRLFIPPYPCGSNVIESLNVSVATAIVCSEFRRRINH